MRDLVHNTKKFIHYGKAGLECYDFDAHGIYHMLYAHLSRVYEFMNSDKTHLMWNNNKQSKLMRRLTECLYLCDYLKNDSQIIGDRLSTYFEEERSLSENRGKNFFDSDYKRLSKTRFRAFQKLDRAEYDYKKKRFFHLLERYANGWWD